MVPDSLNWRAVAFHAKTRDGMPSRFFTIFFCLLSFFPFFSFFSVISFAFQFLALGPGRAQARRPTAGIEWGIRGESVGKRKVTQARQGLARLEKEGRMGTEQAFSCLAPRGDRTSDRWGIIPTQPHPN